MGRMQIGKVPMFPIPTGPLQLMRGPPGLVIIDTDNMGSKLTSGANRIARAPGIPKIGTTRRCYDRNRWNHFASSHSGKGYVNRRKPVWKSFIIVAHFAKFDCSRSCTSVDHSYAGIRPQKEYTGTPG